MSERPLTFGTDDSLRSLSVAPNAVNYVVLVVTVKCWARLISEGFAARRRGMPGGDWLFLCDQPRAFLLLLRV